MAHAILQPPAPTAAAAPLPTSEGAAHTGTIGAGNAALALRIRNASRGDRSTIRRIEAACFGWMRHFFGLSPKVGTPTARAWIAEVDGQPAGYLIAYLKPLHGVQTLYVGGVATLSQFRKRGIAEALMAEVFTVDPNVWLHVRASNTPAVRLYEKLGMQVVERLTKFYSNGEDALIMASEHAQTSAS